jgi:hypothetical protein
MNDSRPAQIVAIAMSAVFVLGMVYLAFGERLGIKSPLPNACIPIEAVSAK